jgi:hypothetical protein
MNCYLLKNLPADWEPPAKIQRMRKVGILVLMGYFELPIAMHQMTDKHSQW